MACLGAIEELGWPLDRIITADVWANDDTPAELPPMVEFKHMADKVIKERWGIEVEHRCANANGNKLTYENCFYRPYTHTTVGQAKKNNNNFYGFPSRHKLWCNTWLKTKVLDKGKKKQGCVSYIGIAADEKERLERIDGAFMISPIAEIGWTEADCFRWCKENDLLSPVYETGERGGCWFCHNQKVDQLRRLRRDYPEYWEMMLRWDTDSPVSFKGNGRTLHDFEMRFAAEESGKLNTKKRFYWKSLDKLREEEEKVSEDK